MVASIKVLAINSESIRDRLQLCWGHVKDWQHLRAVQKSREWLEKANGLFTPTTFIAYIDKAAVGIIEFIPQKLMKKIGLCPCRADPEKEEIESRYVLGKRFDNCLFISCFWVDKDHQGKGVGKTLLDHFFSSQAFKDSDGALVYVTQRDQSWDSFIHWPAGPKELYLKAGFTVEKRLDRPVGYLLYYKRLQA